MLNKLQIRETILAIMKAIVGGASLKDRKVLELGIKLNNLKAKEQELKK